MVCETVTTDGRGVEMAVFEIDTASAMSSPLPAVSPRFCILSNARRVGVVPAGPTVPVIGWAAVILAVVFVSSAAQVIQTRRYRLDGSEASP